MTRPLERIARRSSRCAQILVVALALSAGVGARDATAQIGPHAENPWDEFRARYNAQRYEEAIPWAIEAIQREPDNASYYLGLARGLFWQGNHELATFYYDLYLEQFGPTLPASTPAANRVDRVRGERNSSNAERPDPSEPVAAPQVQEQARAMLRQRIEEGTVLTATGGGAWPVYQGLLRSGYARPDLLVLRRELAEALTGEAWLFVPTDQAMLPAMSDTQWTAQRQRMQNWQELLGVVPAGPGRDASPDEQQALLRQAAPGSPEVRHARVASMLALAEGQLQYLNMNWDRAQSRFEDAIALDPENLPAHMGRLNALYHLPTATRADREAALAVFAAAVANDPASEEVLRLYRASYLAQDRNADEATQVLADLLGL